MAQVQIFNVTKTCPVQRYNTKESSGSFSLLFNNLQFTLQSSILSRSTSPACVLLQFGSDARATVESDRLSSCPSFRHA
jgi:hypothetical protein